MHFPKNYCSDGYANTLANCIIVLSEVGVVFICGYKLICWFGFEAGIIYYLTVFLVRSMKQPSEI